MRSNRPSTVRAAAAAEGKSLKQQATRLVEAVNVFR